MGLAARDEIEIGSSSDWQIDCRRPTGCTTIHGNERVVLQVPIIWLNPAVYTTLSKVVRQENALYQALASSLSIIIYEVAFLAVTSSTRSLIG